MIETVDAVVAPRTASLVAGGLLLLLVVLGATGTAWGHHLPAAVDLQGGVSGERPSLRARHLLLAVQADRMVPYGVAAVAFTRQALLPGSVFGCGTWTGHRDRGGPRATAPARAGGTGGPCRGRERWRR